MSSFVINPYAFGAGEDADAAAYLNAVEAEDGQALEAGVRKAVDDFVKGCKADDIWSAIKACCILAGARTLDGALTPLVGTAPTNNNFVSGDYDREDGLVGDGSTTYLDSGRNNNSDPQDDNHNALYVVLSGVGGRNALGAGGSNNGSNTLGTGGGVRSRSSSADTSISFPTGLFAISRSSGTQFTVRAGGTNYAKTRNSQTPANDNVGIFASIQGGSPILFSSGRYAFYSIGESLDLADLDSRVSTLMTDLAAAIP